MPMIQNKEPHRVSGGVTLSLQSVSGEAGISNKKSTMLAKPIVDMEGR